MLPGKKSFSQRRKSRHKGREAALQEKRIAGFDEPPRIDHGGAAPQQKARRRSKPEEYQLFGRLLSALVVYADHYENPVRVSPGGLTRDSAFRTPHSELRTPNSGYQGRSLWLVRADLCAFARNSSFPVFVLSLTGREALKHNLPLK